MKKRDYFLYALNNNYFIYKRWIMSVFSITLPSKEDEKINLFHDEKGLYFYNYDDLRIDIEDVVSNEPLFRFKDKLTLKKGDLKNLDEDVETTYGRALINCILLIYPFGDKIKYINGEISVKQIEKIVLPRFSNDPVDGTNDPNKIYVSEYKKFVDSALSLVGYTQLAIPSATKKSLTTDPRIPEIRKQLLEKYKDRLNDPAVIAEIEKVLIDVDKKWLEGDASEGFFIQDKHFSIVRKKMFLMHGIEKGFKSGGEIELIENSLNEGWDITKLPSMVNSQREGTFNRGAQTALGGEAAKFLGRVFQNAVISEDDCGTKLGWDRLITEKNKGDYEGLYMLVNNKSEVLDSNKLNSLVGKVITVRSPQFCKTEGASFCSKCMGDKISISPTSLTMHAVSVGSQIMSAMMKSMHGKKLETSEFKIEHIR